MAHVGKDYPHALDGSLQGYPYPFNHLARKWFLKTLSASGTIPLTWAGVEVISGTQERIAGPGMRWRFDHPSISGSWIEINWTMAPNVLNSNSLSAYDNFLGLSLYTASVLTAYAYTRFNNTSGDPWALTGGYLRIIGWNNAQFIPPTVGNVLALGWRYATWAEQTDYHPYRH